MSSAVEPGGAHEAPASLHVRAATKDDAHGIARVHVRSWREAYRHVFSSYLLDGLQIGTRAQRWERILIGGAHVWVALDAMGAESGGGTSIVGWASAGPARDADGPAALELQGLYVLSAYYGSGAAQLLIDAALGSDPAYLWVLADNPRAQAFYRRNGFALDGVSRIESFGGEPAAEVRMLRR